ncbi:MAG: NADH-quinone oxidoreductase subunit M [Bdellovibrionota bacterium]
MLLSAITFLPLVFAILVMLTPRDRWVRPLALVLSLVELVLSLVMLSRFDKTTPALQMGENFAWVPDLGINYSMAVDGISLWLVILTTVLMPIVVLGSWNSIEKQIKGFHACLFLLMTSMIGSFFAMDAILFYVFFELSLVPMYFMIGIWGGQRKIYATVKFFIYTMVGSLMMLLAIIYLMFAARDTLGTMSASLLTFYQLKIPFVAGDFLNPQTLLFFAFSLAFAIKVPMFPVHTWLPDAHVEAPTPGSVILAGVMLKMGSYGFLRFVLPMFPEAAEHFAWLFMFLGVVGIIYGALVAMVQPDIKKLVAYSSVSHMGYVMIGLFAFNSFGVTGSLYQMLAHGVSTGALFLLVGMIYERTHSREISRYGGLASVMPIFAILFVIVTMSSIAVPMTNGFIGEFLILLGTFEANKTFAIFAVSGVILGAVYMLWAVKRIFFGPAGELVKDTHHPLHDLSLREIIVMAPLVVLIFWMGLFPNHILDYSKTSIEHFVNNKDSYQLAFAEDVEKAPTSATENGAKQ